MHNNDDIVFFEKYSKIDRSTKGLSGAGEWKTLQKLLPDFKDKRVLDLGCGFGWHCQYAIEHGANAVTGVDISEKMLTVAKEKTDSKIRCIQMPIEDIAFGENSFDAVISSLAFSLKLRTNGYLNYLTDKQEFVIKIKFLCCNEKRT
ncbi:methylase involved in ubiquinone/menaquinone biosynthesis [Desulfitobacterium dehalogenans ATCC 51507]|uniref:Methylase involved in ubiquinone/menaquinone biosynthesis n=1 Tax=Desulfitobacterium dehalogenans (strain ATCC 51507 / DSM 9161 / JW/IU-DC1) TaxID=756499 RepID=I4A7Y6_DESDJ|nr:methylase involved in ubiquinone/menaquinone biosynthesis [Desulfitobacterium dehalogenans ATCC 51507]